MTYRIRYDDAYIVQVCETLGSKSDVLYRYCSWCQSIRPSEQFYASNWACKACVGVLSTQGKERKRKDKIRYQTKKAIQKGQIKAPTACRCLKKWENIHHRNYDDPFDVEFLCKDCHKNLHYS